MKKSKLKTEIKKISELMEKSFPLLDRAKRTAKYLYRNYMKEEKEGRDCGKLYLDWVKEHFWGKVISMEIPTFHKVWKALDERGYTKNNPLQFGDIDYGLWVEYPKDDKKKVIVSTCYCSCADDNTHIFVLDEPYKDSKLFKNHINLRVATVWPREKKTKTRGYKQPDGSYSWGDDRDIDLPSLNTYRKRDFVYGYSDGRDKGHCIMYETREKNGGSAKDASWSENKIAHSIWLLKYYLEVVENEKEYKC